LKKEDCRTIKENLVSVQAGLPREPKFQITLADILRLYGQYGSREEIEGCLKDLQKEGSLMKGISGNYVFVNETKQRLSELGVENEKAVEERNQASNELEATKKLHVFWLDNLKENQECNQQYAALRQFVSVYWQSKSSIICKKFCETEVKSEAIKTELYEIKKTLGDR
jgi:hypothetical protein